MKTQNHTQLKTLFLTTALAFTTLLAGGQTTNNQSKNNKDGKQRSTLLTQQLKNTPDILVKIIPGDKNTGFPSFIDIDISEKLGLEKGHRIARFFNSSDKLGEFLNQYGPVHAVTDDPSSTYSEPKMNQAALEAYKEIAPFLKQNKQALDDVFYDMAVSEIDYQRQQVTFSMGKQDNMTVDYDNQTICKTSWSDMRAGFIPTNGYAPKNLNDSDVDPAFKENILDKTRSVLEIGAQKGNTPSKNYHWNP